MDKKNKRLKTGERLRSDGRYEYRYTDPVTKKRCCIYDKELPELRAKEKEIERLMMHDLTVSPKIRSLTLNEWFDKYMKIVLISETTRNDYKAIWKNHIQHTLGVCKLTDIRPYNVKEFYAQMTNDGYAKGTINNIHRLLVPVFNMAIDDYVIFINPALRSRGKYGVDTAKRESLTLDEQDTFINFVTNNVYYRKHLPLINFMIGTACRVGEISGLTWSDIDLKNREVNISHQLVYKNYGDGCKFHLRDTKTPSGRRIIPMTNATYKALIKQKEYQFMLGIDHSVTVEGLSNFVFTSRYGMPLAPNAVNSILYGITDAYNKTVDDNPLPKISAHILRHTGCTRMAECGIDPKVLQYIMGHAHPETTMDIYNHTNDLSRIKKEIQKLEGVLAVC